MFDPGDVVLVKVQFTDSFTVKKRPVVVLFEELNNVIVAGITSNLMMKGIPLSKDEGALKDSIIKLNYIFTISSAMIVKKFFKLTSDKKKLVYEELTMRLTGLKE